MLDRDKSPRNPICRVFIVLYLWSLSTLKYWYRYIYLYFVYVVFTLLHQRFRNNSMSIKSKQWFSVVNFFDKNEERSTKKCLKTNLYRKRNFYPRYLSKNIYQTFSKVFHQQIQKRNLRKKRSLKRNLYQINFNRNLYHKVFDNLISTKNIEGEISTK